MSIKHRLTGSPKQVEFYIDYLKHFAPTKCLSISKPYKQNRKCQYNQEIAVYMEFEDYNFEKKEN